MSLGIKKGDTVIVTVGKDRGKTGKVRNVLAKGNEIIVERINLLKRHTKPSKKNAQGGIVEKEASLKRMKIMLYCQRCKKGVRIGAKFLDDGSKVRICKKCGEII